MTFVPKSSPELRRILDEHAIDAAYEDGTPIDGNLRSIHDPDLWRDEDFATYSTKHPEHRLRGPILDYFRPKGWYVVFDPDGSDFIDAIMVKGDDVMVLELKTSAAEKAFGQARHRTLWADYVAVVAGTGARRAKKKLREGGWDMGFEWKGSSKNLYDGVGLFALRDGHLVQVRRPKRNEPSKDYKDRSFSWMKLYRQPGKKRFARRIASTYLRSPGYKTTHGIPIENIRREAEGLPVADLSTALPINQKLLEEFP